MSLQKSKYSACFSKQKRKKGGKWDTKRHCYCQKVSGPPSFPDRKENGKKKPRKETKENVAHERTRGKRRGVIQKEWGAERGGEEWRE